MSMEIKDNLQNEKTFIEHIKTVTSTNALLKERILKGELSSFAALSADEQTEGRGRRGRTWLNTEGALMISFSVPLAGIDADRIPLVSFAAALAALETVRSAGIDASIKWPNDIIVLHETGCKKLAGILSELAAWPEAQMYAVIGVGMNVNCTELPSGLLQPASSILLETGAEADIGALEATLTELIKKYVALLREDCGTLTEEYRKNCAVLGRTVTAEDMFGTVITGVAEGIDPRGRLVIATDGRTVKVGAADISIRF